MDSSSVSVEAVSPDELKAEVQRLISQMQSCCFKLSFSSLMSRCRILGCCLLLVIIVTVVVEKVYGPNAATGASVVSVLVFALVLQGLCQLPRTSRLVSDLRRLSAEFKVTTAALKRHVSEDVWFRSWSSRWHSVEELEKSGADIRGFVETMGSVVNAFLISELKKRLKESQKHLSNI